MTIILIMKDEMSFIKLKKWINSINRKFKLNFDDSIINNINVFE